MNIDDCIIIYEEINEKNKNLFENFEKNNFHIYSVILFDNKDTNEHEEIVRIKYCKIRNLCRVYDNVTNKFDKEDTMMYVLNTLKTYMPADCIIWYCDNDINWLLDIEFKNPYFCSHDPFNEHVGSKIAVNKENDSNFKTNLRLRYTGNDTRPDIFQERRLSPLREHRDDMFTFTKKYFGSENPIELDIRFDIEDLQYLKSLVYGGKTVNDDGTMSQKEVSGILCLERSDDSFELKIDKTKNFNAHDEEKVRFVNGLINFHTHPLEVYDKYDVDLLYPSPSDYLSILSFLIQKYCFEDSCLTLSPLLFSCVIAIEGVYIVSLNKNYCSTYKKDQLRAMISDNKGGFYQIKQSVRDAVNSKRKNISGFFYGNDRTVSSFYETHCKYIGDPKDHPLGYTQVGGYDFDTLKHNRREDQLHHFPETLEMNGYSYSRIEQAAKDYCLKINRRELVSDTYFKDGPVLNVQFFTYEELENESFKIYTSNVKSDYLPLQTLLDEETIQDIKLFSQK